MANATEMSSNANDIRNILNLLKEGEELIVPSTDKDIVLVLGLTSAGKTTFTQFISGHDDNLTSVPVIVNHESNEEDVDDTDDNPYGDSDEKLDTSEQKIYRIVDTDSKIGNSAVDSKTIFPDLFEDTEKNVAFYDCPGFSDTRSAAHEIAATYFIKNIIDSAKRIKLLFVVEYSNVQLGSSSSKLNFMTFIKHVTQLIKDIKRFDHSMSLLITKVDRKTKELKQVQNGIVNFLIDFKKDMINSENQKEFYKDGIDLIDILTRNKGKNTIGIFKQPSKEGRVSELLKNFKIPLRKIIFDQSKFTTIKKEDFGYTLSSSAEIHVNDLVKQANSYIALGIERIGRDIKKYYVSKEEHLNDIDQLRDFMYLGYETFIKTRNLKNAEPFELVRHVYHNLQTLNIDISRANIVTINKYIKYIEFFNTVSNRVIKKQMQDLNFAENLKDLLEYFSDSVNWYSYLIRFRDLLSRYEVQKNISEYRNKQEYKELEKMLKHEIESSDQHKIIENMKNLSDHDFMLPLSINKEKFQSLRRVLRSTLPKNSFNVSCTNEKLIIQGENVKFGDILQQDCPQPKYIEIIALNKVFIDADFDNDHNEVHLSIIAPIWEIIGKPKIILDGKPGEPHLTKKPLQRLGRGDNLHGYDGETGNPGADSGTFLGIGLRFRNSENLSVSLKGGNGGPGQNGGDGAPGKDGALAKLMSAADVRAKKCKRLYNENKCTHLPFVYTGQAIAFVRTKGYHCDIDNEKCTEGSPGGKGGKGGRGGKGNNELVVSLKKGRTSKIHVNHQDGKTGIPGVSGAVGEAGKKGQLYKLGCRTDEDMASKRKESDESDNSYLAFNSLSYLDNITDHTSCTPRKSYEPNAETANTDEPVTDTSSIALKNNHINDHYLKKLDAFGQKSAINDFKRFLRKNLRGHVREAFLKDFLRRLDSRVELEDINTTLGFVDELQGLEDQFYELHMQQLPLLPFYESLLRRLMKFITKIDKNGQLSESNKKVLNYLYTAIFSKIVSIKNENTSKLILNVEKYLDNEKEEIEKLKNFASIDMIDRLHEDYSSSIKNEISQATSLINTKVVPEINNILEKVNDELQSLIENVNSKVEESIKAKNELLVEKDKLINQMAWKFGFEMIKIAGLFLNFLGPVGTAASVVVSTGVEVAETLAFQKDGGVKTLDSLITTVKGSLPAIQNAFSKKQKLLKQKLDDLQKDLKEEDPDEQEEEADKPEIKVINEIKTKIADIQSEIDKQEDGMSYDKVLEKKKLLENLLKDKKKALKNEKREAIVTKVLKYVNRTEKVLQDLTTKFSAEQEKIDDVHDEIKKADDYLEALRDYENEIYETMLPTCRTIMEQIKNLQNKSEDQSAALDISKWEIQSAVKDIIRLIKKATEELDPREDLTYALEKLEDSASIMIRMYQLIQSYHDKQKLAKLIANVNSNTALEIPITDDSLRHAVHRLKFIIQSNIILEKYEFALNSFRHLIYPFASEYTEKNYMLPFQIGTNDTQSIVSATVDKMMDLKKNIGYTHTLLGDLNEIIAVQRFSKDESNDPFYTWNYNENRPAISKLLNGEEIVLRSDITKGLRSHFNAVKFKNVYIKFETENRELQAKLKDKLKHFQMKMVHLGYSQYRCNNMFHAISHKNVTFEYTAGLDMDSDLNRLNNNKKLLYKHDPLLSPYTIWSIQLKTKTATANFDLLSEFKNKKIDLVLEGDGQYVQESEQLNQICNNDLNKYYTKDDTVFLSENVSLLTKKDKIEFKLHNKLPVSAKRQRKRRSLNEHQWNQGLNENIHATSGVTSNMKSSFINNIFNAIGAGLVALKYFNPVNSINEWFDTKKIDTSYESFTSYDKNVIYSDLEFIPNLDSYDFKVLKNHAFVNDESATTENNVTYDSAFCNHGNLLLLDLVVRSKSGVKHEKVNFMRSEKVNSEIAQTLAYREHVPQ